MVHIKVVTRWPWGEESSYKDISEHDWIKLKQSVFGSHNIDWNEFPPEIKHVVLFSELFNDFESPYYANIYLQGACQACTEEYFEKYYQKPRQYTYALHRP